MKSFHINTKAFFAVFLFLLLLTPTSIYAELVGYWCFDENTGNIANDSSGFGNNGTIYGATWVPGKCGSALTFDAGSDGDYDYVDVPNSDSINTSRFTVSCWVSFSGLDRGHVIVNKRNEYWHHNYALQYVANWSKPTGIPKDYLYVDLGNGTQSTVDFSTYAPVTLNENEFYYIAATYDQSFLRLYLDGVEIASSSVNISDNVGTGNLHIGAHGIISMEPMQGIIDEIRIYNHALTQAEILADMTACVLPLAANAGPDQVILDSNEVNLDGSQSSGTIVSYEWLLQHQENSDYDRDATGVSPTVSHLEPGFYVVTLTVTDDDELTDIDTMLLAVAGPCDGGWPEPNTDFNLHSFKIKKFKRLGWTTTSMFGTIDLPPDLNLGSTVESRITIELFGVLPDGSDLVMSDEATLKVKDRKHILMIRN